MCVALDQISKLNIILRDIKPANMMIVSEFESEYNASTQKFVYSHDDIHDKLNVVLIDFGLAKQYVCHQEVCKYAGTPLYVCTVRRKIHIHVQVFIFVCSHEVSI